MRWRTLICLSSPSIASSSSAATTCGCESGAGSCTLELAAAAGAAAAAAVLLVVLVVGAPLHGGQTSGSASELPTSSGDVRAGRRFRAAARPAIDGIIELNASARLSSSDSELVLVSSAALAVVPAPVAATAAGWLMVCARRAGEMRPTAQTGMARRDSPPGWRRTRPCSPSTSESIPRTSSPRRACCCTCRGAVGLA